ncbi:MAG TPA: hypothetical protein VJ978_10955 [Nitriliruptoraceae bacterium]|nr:hypothetical protein [Nitriliruptoraceae bacterium]
MFKRAGTTLPHQSSTAIKAYVPQVTKSLSSMKPGDMLAKNGHVAMYIGDMTDTTDLLPGQARDIVTFGHETGRVMSNGAIVGRSEPFAKCSHHHVVP